MKSKTFSGLVLGCGDVGGRLAQSWARQTWNVWGVRRQREMRDLGAVASISGDLKYPEAWVGQVPRDLDCVVFAAAGGGGGEERYREVYVQGTENCLQALEDRALSRILWCSSTGVYGENGGNWVDEESPADAQGWRGRLVREGEIRAQRWCRDHGIPLCIVRLGGIYGPGRLRMLERIWTEGPAPKPAADTATQWTNRIHVEDAAGLLHHLSLMDASDLPPLVVATDGMPTPKWEIEAFVAKQLGLPPRDESKTTEVGTSRSPFGNKRCRNRLMASLGYQLRFPDWQVGYQDTLSGFDPSAGSRPPEA